MKPCFLVYLLLQTLLLLSPAHAQLGEKKTIRVFVALCDNETQAIAKVNPRIGNGDDPPSNLYWGCSDGLSAYFKKSYLWKLTKSETKPSEKILERLTFTHTQLKNVTLVAEAYRGSEMKQCLIDFFEATSSSQSPDVKLVAFIGHNGLMENEIPEPEGSAKRDAIVLGCLTHSYFSPKLAKIGVRPVLMTRSLMYPGSFLLHDALEGYLRNEPPSQLRERAARAYAKNQKISVSAARTIFSELSD